MATQTTNLNLTKPARTEYYNIDTYNTNLDKIDASSVDYVTQQGTSGIWTYRKWHSGICELWGRYEDTPITQGYIAIAWPSGITFSSILTQLTTQWYGASSSRTARTKLLTDHGTTTNYTVYIREYNGTVSTGNFAGSVYVVGRLA